MIASIPILSALICLIGLGTVIELTFPETWAMPRILSFIAIVALSGYIGWRLDLKLNR